MPGRIDLTGGTFGAWLVLELSSKRHGTGGTFWRARCGECGRIADVDGASLRDGKSTSCRPCAAVRRGRARRVNRVPGV